MATDTPVIQLNNLTCRYGKVEAVNGLSLTVRPGRCYGFFGRNGAGKTTTIKCLLNLLRPGAGTVRVFGLDPQRQEVAVKSRLTYVPDTVAFYPWMTVSQTLEFLASFRPRWNQDIETDLLRRFQLDPTQKASHLSKGQKQRVQLARVLLHDSDPDHRTVLVSTHLISEFEGLIDEFTIIEQGRELLTMAADDARDRFRKIRARFSQPPSGLDLAGALNVRQSGREIEIVANGNSEQLLETLRSRQAEELRCDSLTLEEIFIASRTLAQAKISPA